MHVVIKGTKTVKEFKELKVYLEQRAKEHSEEHKKAFSHWKEGDIDKVWIDKDGYMCIQYESGTWWHYSEEGTWW